MYYTTMPMDIILSNSARLDLIRACYLIYSFVINQNRGQRSQRYTITFYKNHLPTMELFTSINPMCTPIYSQYGLLQKQAIHPTNSSTLKTLEPLLESLSTTSKITAPPELLHALNSNALGVLQQTRRLPTYSISIRF
ncbi:uncharacterized protein MELLADRAFT_59216 [Melampsora larici-populina 98AG31]|uniref:Uncharacterized protein n=1 Tax=Melampsora larici-populina (strain 98AG31 / pathotype 3-4-7) TaxID=747676 RepID=F4R5H0_MELLP|nr:uncharacterized protein MELLADRAFT_59216 [Melampsora larici-populina 98AG31]EGG12044.1 hypothetical protein MELLADRAFT_59216 [Melampsora larici-populina 98AG31]